MGGLDETFGAREWPGRRRARGGGFGGAAGLLEAPGRAAGEACRGGAGVVGFGGAAAIVPGLGAHFDDVALTETLMPRVAEKLPRLQALYAARPFTLVHGDYHSKQLFFPTDAGGEFADLFMFF